MALYDKEGNEIDVAVFVELDSDPTYKRIGKTVIDKVTVSTIWIGMEFTKYETMVLGGEHNLYCKRWKTEDEAIAGHEETCKMVFGEDFSEKEE